MFFKTSTPLLKIQFFKYTVRFQFTEYFLSVYENILSLNKLKIKAKLFQLIKKNKKYSNIVSFDLQDSSKKHFNTATFLDVQAHKKGHCSCKARPFHASSGTRNLVVFILCFLYYQGSKPSGAGGTQLQHSSISMHPVRRGNILKFILQPKLQGLQRRYQHWQ